MERALYIHGFGSTAKSSSTMKVVSEVMGNIGIIVEAVEWDYMDPVDSLHGIEKYIRDNGIKLVIGHSLGGFMALSIVEPVKKIVINPCLHPAKDLPNLTSIDYETIKLYRGLEKWMYDNGSPWTNMVEDVLAIFGDDDELFSYRDEYSSRFGQAIRIKSNHRPTVESLNSVIDDIIKFTS